MRFGAPVPGPDLAGAIAHELAALDHELQSSDPEQPLAGYLRAVPGRRSGSDEVGLAARLLTRITGDRA